MRWLRLRPHRVVVLAAAVFAVLAALTLAFGIAPLNSTDETAHIDYAVELWHGHLPQFWRGVQIAPTFGIPAPVQWTAQHPPLFYAIIAPVVGPLWDGGHQYVAVEAARSVNAVLVGLTVLAFAWSTSRIVPGRPLVTAAAAVVIAGASIPLQVGATAYNDIPNLALGALALGVGAAVIRDGLTGRRVLLAALVAAGGMLSRLSFAAFLVALVVAVVVSPWARGRTWRGLLGHAAATAIVVLAPLLSAGWFYLRNRRLSGNIEGRYPQYGIEHLGRTNQSFMHVAENGTFWSFSFGLFRGQETPAGEAGGFVLLLVPLLLAVVVAVVGLVRRRPRVHLAGLLVGAMLVAVALVVVVSQIQYTAGGGGVQPRYLMPVLPALVPAMAIGLAGLWAAVSAVLTSAWSLFAAFLWSTLPDFTTSASPTHASLAATRGLGIAAGVAEVVLVGTVVWAALARQPDEVPAD